MVGVHVGDDAGRSGSERIGAGCSIFGSVNPAHNAEIANVIDVHGRQAERAEIGQVDPVSAVGMVGQVKFGVEDRAGKCSQLRTLLAHWIPRNT